MIRHNLLLFLRNLLRGRAHSIINIIGLSVGLASTLLIVTYIWHEMSYDNFHPDVENTYRVYCDQPDNTYMNSTLFDVMPIAFQPELKKSYPEVKYATRVSTYQRLMSVDGVNYNLENAYTVDQDFFNIFEVRMVYGQKEGALTDAYSVLLSKSISFKYFGDENPVGKTMILGDTINLVVKGVFEDNRPNTHLQYKILMPFQIEEMQLSESERNNWNNHSVKTYIQLQKGTSASAFEEKLKELVIAKRGAEVKDTYLLQPVRDIHLYGKLNFELSANGDIKYIYIFGAIALFLLLIASFNYMNLATARSLQRAKEVGVRKVIGATHRQLFWQYIGESLYITFLSLIVALILIEVFEPVFSRFVDREIHFYNHPFGFYLIVIFIVLFIAFVSGSYPAVFLSRFSPVKVLKGSVLGSMKTIYLRNIIVTFQFFISIVLVICTLVIIGQLIYIKNKDLGFETKNVLSFTMNSADWLKGGKVMENELLAYPEIISVTSSNYLPSGITSTSTLYYSGKEGRKPVRVYVNQVAYNFLDFYKIPLLKGEDFNQEMTNGYFVMVNEEAEKAMNVDNIIGATIDYGWPERKKYQVVGVMKNFHFTPLDQEIKAACFFLTDGGRRISVKFAEGKLAEAIKVIEPIVKKFSPKYTYNYAPIKDTINKSYLEEQRLSGLFTFFTILAVVIACLGLFGLISFIIDQRTKEIGVRKVMGASIAHILALLSNNIVKWVILSNVIAWPVAWYFMDKWLGNFAYGIKLNFWIFILAGTLVFLIAIATTIIQSLKAAMMNPVESLKYE